MTFVIAEPLVGKFRVRSNDCILEIGVHGIIWNFRSVDLKNSEISRIYSKHFDPGSLPGIE